MEQSGSQRNLGFLKSKECSLENRKKARRMSICNRKLLILASEGNFKEVENCIEEGADVNFKDKDGNTPLHWAVESGNLRIVVLLLNKGAKIIKNDQNETPIDLSKRIDKQGILKVLEDSLDSKSLMKSQPQPKKVADKPLDHEPHFVRQKKLNKGINAIHGNIYQLKILMLFLYRGVALKYSFRLGTEIKEANKFDDLVFEYFQGSKKMYRLLQAKHKLDESKQITVDNLLSKNDDFSLIKYLDSYRNSKKEELFSDSTIKDITICTNIDFDYEDLKIAQIEIERMNDKDDILDIIGVKKQPRRYKLKKNIVPLLAEKVECSTNEIKDFFDHLVIAVRQPNETELGEIVKKEIGQEFDFIATENIYNKFFITMLDWLQGKQKGIFLSYEEGKEFFEEARRGIPIRYNVKDPVMSFIGRTEKLNELHRILQDEVSQFISVCGLGGVGKTEFVRKYINGHSESYDNKILWINAESYQNLVDSFRRLACDKLGINTKNANNDDKKITSIVEEVYRFFSNGKSLFIFDNAEKYKSPNEYDNGIDKFLPPLLPNSKTPSVLITSRNKKWPNSIKLLPLDVFDLEETIEFIKKSLSIENNIQDEDIKELSSELQLFPLALQQAVAYITMQDENLKNMGLEFKIGNYLKRYREKTRDLLNFKFTEDSDNDYAKTALTTWDITLDAMRQKENGSDALEILNIIAYFISENIPVKVFSDLVSDEEKLGSAIELLKQYSMVNLENEKLSIHRLVQQITRIKLEESNGVQDILTKALTLFNNKNNVNSKNVDHAMSVWNHSCQYSELIANFLPIPSYISVVLLDNARFDEAYAFGLKISELFNSMPCNDPKVVAGFLSTKHNIASVLLNQGKYDVALEIFQDLYNQQKKLLGPLDPMSLCTQDNIALTLFYQGKYKEALKYSQEVHGIRKMTIGKNHPDTLSTKHSVAAILLSQGKYDEALPILQEIHNIQESTLGKSENLTLNTKNSIANALLHKCQYTEALRIFQEILNTQEATIENENHPSILTTNNNIAGVFAMQGKFGDAYKIYQKVLDGQKMVFGENHPNVLRTYVHISEMLRNLGKYDEALKMFQEVLVKFEKTLESDHPAVLDTRHSIALTLESQGKLNDALQIHQDVLSKRKVVLGNDHPNTLKSCNCIALIFSKLGDADKAHRYYQKILEVQKRTLGENHPDTSCTKNNFGMVCYNKNECDEALKLFREAFHSFKITNPNHPDALIAKHNIGLVLCKQNKFDEALKNFKEVLNAQEAILGKEHSNVLNTNCNIAAVLIEKGRYNEAIGILQEIVPRYNHIFGLEHVETLKLKNMIQFATMKVNLLNTVKTKNFEKLVVIIKNGGDINTKDDNGVTLLHYAINNSDIQTVSFLLENNANVTLISNKGNTSLHTATSKGHEKIIQILLKHVSSDKLNDFIDAKTINGGTTALHVAAKNGCFEIVKCLLKHGATFEIENKESKMPLDLSKNQKVFKFLKRVKELFKDAKNGNGGIINKLKALEKDEFIAVTSARDNQGYKLLQVAINNEQRSIASQLIELLRKRTD